MIKILNSLIFILKVLFVFLFVFMVILLYVKMTNKKIELNFPIWFNIEFYLIITPELIEIGITYI